MAVPGPFHVSSSGQKGISQNGHCLDPCGQAIPGLLLGLIEPSDRILVALGPAIAGLMVVNESILPVYVMSTIPWLLTLVLFIAANKRLRPG